MRVFLTSLGCKLNQSEVEGWARQLAPFGAEVVADPAGADLCVVNTCTVTHVAAHKSRQLLRRCHRANPQAQIVVTGCYAEMSPAEASCLPGVTLFCFAAQLLQGMGKIRRVGCREGQACPAGGMGELE